MWDGMNIIEIAALNFFCIPAFVCYEVLYIGH